MITISIHISYNKYETILIGVWNTLMHVFLLIRLSGSIYIVMHG